MRSFESLAFMEEYRRYWTDGDADGDADEDEA
jgi:hypothetical protein